MAGWTDFLKVMFDNMWKAMIFVTFAMIIVLFGLHVVGWVDYYFRCEKCGLILEKRFFLEDQAMLPLNDGPIVTIVFFPNKEDDSSLKLREPKFAYRFRQD